jgi:hypothetical protein
MPCSCGSAVLNRPATKKIRPPAAPLLEASYPTGPARLQPVVVENMCDYFLTSSTNFKVLGLKMKHQFAS